MGVEPTRDSLAAHPDLKSGRPTGDDAFPSIAGFSRYGEHEWPNTRRFRETHRTGVTETPASVSFRKLHRKRYTFID